MTFSSFVQLLMNWTFLLSKMILILYLCGFLLIFCLWILLNLSICFCFIGVLYLLICFHLSVFLVSPLELVKYLGVTLSSSWSLQISNICAKGRKLLGLFNFISILILLHFCIHLYISLIHPHLEYCSFLFDPHSSHLSSKIEKVQYLACKIFSKEIWSSDYTFLLSKLQLPTLHSFCQNFSLKSIFCWFPWSSSSILACSFLQSLCLLFPGSAIYPLQDPVCSEFFFHNFD